MLQVTEIAFTCHPIAAATPKRRDAEDGQAPGEMIRCRHDCHR